MGLDITVAQAAHVKHVPGRKTDIKDSHWLATLHRFGLDNVRKRASPQGNIQKWTSC